MRVSPPMPTPLLSAPQRALLLPDGGDASHRADPARLAGLPHPAHRHPRLHPRLLRRQAWLLRLHRPALWHPGLRRRAFAHRPCPRVRSPVTVSPPCSWGSGPFSRWELPAAGPCWRGRVKDRCDCGVLSVVACPCQLGWLVDAVPACPQPSGRCGALCWCSPIGQQGCGCYTTVSPCARGDLGIPCQCVPLGVTCG